MIALILARGGSKGVPNKNIKLLDDKPLIAHPIEAAKQTRNIDEIFVSTDSIVIADIALHYGGTVIIRPAELATDNSLDIDAFKHFCNVKNYIEPIVHLRATTPLLNPDILDSAINYFNEISDCTSLRSGHETSESAYKYFKSNGLYWTPLIDNADVNQPRQNVIKTFTPNGYIDIVKPSIFMSGTSFHGNKILAFKTKFAPEVDSLDDFDYISYLISKRNA